MADAQSKNHDYHILEPSPWPLIGSIGAFVMAIGGVVWMQSLKGAESTMGMSGPWVFVIGLLIVLYTMYAWWSDTITEANAGDHTPVVSMHLRYGMIMFIASEVMFFVAWFWAFFDASLFYDEAIQVGRTAYTGGQWPPAGINVLDPLHLPLFNTITLLLSGTTVTWAHHALLEGDRKGLIWGLALTVGLGFIFAIVQGIEYAVAPFSFSDSLYGATFFMATGFHGFHVIIGVIFLAVCLVRAMNGAFTPKQHFGFEAAAWYWHFVDVVWLFLFVAVYIWASAGATIAH
ncbi:cytochrome c oxidase subunit 3 [Ahrensia sp. R2A130]|uniref:cytochrome c oxidase subunit 3 n=1 Tax=Ahrensia sp. R2A130 TaxID=744979 RepID=UPI0001E0D865|nr:cytochrome c oxidase subunit 3 [Ahrensia sp. R2A130]EFL88885.1 cytoChrome c oxidase subunit 3 [Ahrensia sp. R2A130]